MRADVLQIIALSSHASAYLRGEAKDAPELLGVHSSFAGVQHLEFDRPSKGHAGGLVANSVGPWLRRLKSESAEGLQVWLRGLPFSMSTPYDKDYGVLTDGDRGLELWRPIWQRRSAIAEAGPSRNNVAYVSTRIQRSVIPSPVSLEESSELLLCTMNELGRYASVNNLDTQQTMVESWMRLHQSRPGSMGQHRAILPDTASEEHVALAGSVIRMSEIFKTPAWTESAMLKQEAGRKICQRAFDCGLTVLEELASAA